jgi:hypothetical protein
LFLGPDSSSPSKAKKKVSRQTSPQASPSNEKEVDNQLTTTKSSVINEIHPPLSDDNQKENNLIDEELPITLPPKKNAFNKKRNSSTSDESDPNEDDSSEIPSHHDSLKIRITLLKVRLFMILMKTHRTIWTAARPKQMMVFHQQMESQRPSTC